MNNKRFVIACIVTTLLVLAVITGLFVMMNRQSSEAPRNTTPLTVSGNLACLQHKNTTPGQPHTLECAIGIKTDDGRFYALQDLPQGTAATPFTAHVTISGNVISPSANEIYDTQGTLKVTSFALIQ